MQSIRQWGLVKEFPTRFGGKTMALDRGPHDLGAGSLPQSEVDEQKSEKELEKPKRNLGSSPEEEEKKSLNKKKSEEQGE